MLCGISWQGVPLANCDQHDNVGQHTGKPCEKGFTNRESEWLGDSLDRTKDMVL
jgi:hypothetical protein